MERSAEVQVTGMASSTTKVRDLHLLQTTMHVGPLCNHREAYHVIDFYQQDTQSLLLTIICVSALVSRDFRSTSRELETAAQPRIFALTAAL